MLAFYLMRILRHMPFRFGFDDHLNQCAAYYCFAEIDLGQTAPRLNLLHVFGLEPLADLRAAECDENGKRIEQGMRSHKAIVIFDKDKTIH